MMRDDDTSQKATIALFKMNNFWSVLIFRMAAIISIIHSWHAYNDGPLIPNHIVSKCHVILMPDVKTGINGCCGPTFVT